MVASPGTGGGVGGEVGGGVVVMLGHGAQVGVGGQVGGGGQVTTGQQLSHGTTTGQPSHVPRIVGILKKCM